jgi:Aminotransferase class I and II
MSKIRPSRKASSFTESVIREMTRLSVAHGAINLSQGFPDFAAPEEIKEAARQAIADDINQYPITWGAEPFRAAIAESYRTRCGMSWVEAERDVTVTCGSTEAMIAARDGHVRLDRGDDRRDAGRARSGRRGRRVRAVLRGVTTGDDAAFRRSDISHQVLSLGPVGPGNGACYGPCISEPMV